MIPLLLERREDIAALNQAISKEDEIVVDLETTGLWAWRGDRILSVSFYLPRTKQTYTVFVGDGGSLFSISPVDLCEIDWDNVNKCKMIMHNAKFDMSFLEVEGVVLDWGRVYDTMHGQFLLYNLSESFSLKRLTSDIERDSEEWSRYAPAGLDLDLARQTAGSRRDLSAVDTAALVAYAETDTVLTYILYMRQRAGDTDTDRAHRPLTFMGREMLLTRATIDMEKRGLFFDHDKHRKIKADMEKSLLAARQTFDFDPMSSNALKNIFQTDTYDKDTLLSRGGDLGARVVSYRDLRHSYGSFVVKMSESVSEDGFLHPNMRQNGTTTGRFTSTRPNMLGLPKKMRAQFAPPRGRDYICVDLAQIELAMCAWYSGCESMSDTLRRQGDIHQTTAELIGVDRQIGKRLNFSMVYGVGAATMADRLGVSPEQAARWLRDFRKAYPELVASKMRCESAARRNGGLKLWNGQYREVPEPRKAWSYLVQSAVAELAKDIIIDLYLAMPEIGGNLVLHVHDEFVIELDKGDSEARRRVESVVSRSGPEGLHYGIDTYGWR